MVYSKFGSKFSDDLGICRLMEDLGEALAADARMLMLGGGNPGKIARLQEVFRQRLSHLLEAPSALEHALGDYDPPLGQVAFRSALAELLQREYGWPVDASNVALTNGSQTAFFYLFNLFAGEQEDGSQKKVLLPLAPEYIGYVDLSLGEPFFTASRPSFELLDDHLFKYHVDFDAVDLSDQIGAICVSRPTNPTGNVLTDAEVERLGELAASRDIPLIIDGAYGTPFPHIIFTDARPVWNENTVLCLSLSKFGLPALRTGIVIASREIVTRLSRMTAVMNLAPGGFGATMALDLVRSGEIIRLSRDVVRPFYQHKAEQALEWLATGLKGLPYRVHRPEGAFFLWLWLDQLPITSAELYRRLKARGVVVMPGEYFFPGLDEAWSHTEECLRISYSQPESVVRAGIEKISEEVRRAYAESVAHRAHGS